MNEIKLEEKDLLDDLLTTQKKITSDYNSFANEVVNNNLKQDLLNILREEHEAESLIVTEMSTRGWYEIKDATEEDIENARQKYNQIDRKYRL